ncbi:MAG TPA: CARDB domain-containing protein, partial [Thermoanaerobaculia bacterium]
LLLLAPAPAKPSPPVTIEAVKVEPAAPGPDTLCRLAVSVRNSGERTASAFEMAVKVNGQEIRSSKGRLYLRPVEPGKTGEIRLPNFWSTEAGRPAPPGGRLTVEVVLTGASWMERTTNGEAEVWTPLGPVPGLPVAKTITLTLAKAR